MDYTGKKVRVKENDELCPEGEFECDRMESHGALNLPDSNAPHGSWWISPKFVEIIP
jgi:hypothetical protein